MPAPDRLPISTYRLQFHSRFTFRDATAIVDYLNHLGISDCYASSYLKAVPGSLHGYDIADPTELNPEIGTAADYWAWIEALHERAMGHVLDVVPNHMGIGKSANPWWLDVLENGPSSRFARFFDIEWHPVKAELANKVLIPILGDQYGVVLERQELKLEYRDGTFVVRSYEELLPVAPDTFDTILTVDLDGWLASHGGTPYADELLSILTASRNLPPRSSRDPEAIATRARDKEVVKRRLAVLADSQPEVRAYIDAAVTRFNGVAGEPRSFDLLDGLLNQQCYRLASWRVASEEINYRRFFDVNQLAALRMEDPAVFEEFHRFIFELVDQGAATGLRIDHVDGLYSPGDYLTRLQERKPIYLVVEKILGSDEHLPAEWPVHGTTGYEFAAAVNGLFVDARNERAMDDIYVRFIRERRGRVTFADLAYRSKKQVLHETMSGDLNTLGHQLNRFSERNRHFRDFTLYSLISTIKEIIACFPVYRTYITADQPVSDHDRRYIAEAVRSAKSRAPGVPSVVFDFIEKVLLKQTPMTSREDRDERAAFTGKFQQLTSPVAAKGIEDTALYVYNRLLSLNEVGGDPTRFGVEPSTLHAWLADRQRRWPAALSATSTHDTKRGEDVRARLNVLSEIPGEWKAAVAKWRALNRRCKSDLNGFVVPDANEEYFLYQTLVGAWPFDFDAQRDTFRERMVAYVPKALREAKVHSSWMSRDEHYEKAVIRFVESILDPRRSSAFLQAFAPFQARVADLGIYNSLAQLLIKITAPGVPDFYQGTELWDLTVVDPDNRRPVDYELRRKLLSSLKGLPADIHTGDSRPAGPNNPELRVRPATAGVDVDELVANRTDGRLKLFAMNRALCARARLRDLYERGAYVPLQTTGERRDCLFAFAREHQDMMAITCVPRLVASLVGAHSGPPTGEAIWSDTRVVLPSLPDDSPPRTRRFRNVFTGAELDGGESLPAAAVFDRCPIALLVATSAV